jgi:hypothetical protein
MTCAELQFVPGHRKAERLFRTLWRSGAESGDGKSGNGQVTRIRFHLIPGSRMRAARPFQWTACSGRAYSKQIDRPVLCSYLFPCSR